MDTNGDARYEFLIKRKPNASENRLAGTYAVISPFIVGPSISESYLPIHDRLALCPTSTPTATGCRTWWTSSPSSVEPNNLDFGTGVRPLFHQSTGAGSRSFWQRYPDAPDPTSGSVTMEVWRVDHPKARPSRFASVLISAAVDAIDNGVRAADLDGDGRQELLVLGERWFCQPQDGHCIVPNGGAAAVRRPPQVRWALGD